MLDRAASHLCRPVPDDWEGGNKRSPPSQDASGAAKRPVSASADSDAAEAAIHEATAARDAAVARELAAAAAAVQEAAASRDSAVARELATLQERTDLKRRCQEHEHSAKQLEKKLQALQKKSGMTVSDKEAGAESLPPSPRKGNQPSLAEQLEAERCRHKETQEKCHDLERKLAEVPGLPAPPLAAKMKPTEEEATGSTKAALVSSGEPGSEELRFAQAVRQYTELEQRHQKSEEKCAELERRCREAERRTLELLRESQGPVEKAILQPETSESPKREDSGDAAVREVKLLTERVEVERRCHEQALLDFRDKERQYATAERRREELEIRLEQEEAARKRQTETCEMLAQRLQDLEASHSGASAVAEKQPTETSRDLEERIESQQTKIEILQRKIQAYENLGFVDPTTQASPLAAAGQRGPANKVGLGGAPSTASTSTMAPNTASTGSGSLPPTVATGAEVNTHMFSQLLASTYAPPVPPTTFVEAREDPDVEPGQPDPAVLVEVVDCKDVLSNGIFAWVGVCNLRPLYRLLGPEPRYLFYAEADIASNWRIVNRMGSEEYVERFRRPTDAKVPVECEKGDAGGSVFEVKLTPEIIQRVSMVNSHDEKVTIRNKLADTYGQQFVNLESKGRGLISKASPVVAIAFALESQQRAIQLLHSQLSVENQRREAAEQHASTMQQAFETLQLRIQAQLPGPPSVAGLQEVQASLVAARHPGAAVDRSMERGEGAARGLASPGSEQEWTSDQGSERGPMPHPPIEPKDKKPVPPPTFRRGPSGLRNSKGCPHAPAYPPDKTAPKVEDCEQDLIVLPDPPPSVEPVPATGEAPIQEN